MAKRIFYKLGGQASVFSDHVNGLKVTKNVPGSTNKPESKTTKVGKANGHIIEISESEAHEMVGKLKPAEVKAAEKEQGYSYSSKEAESEPATNNKPFTEEDEELRQNLLERLKKIKMTPSKRQEVQNLNNEELAAFLDKEEK